MLALPKAHFISQDWPLCLFREFREELTVVILSNNFSFSYINNKCQDASVQMCYGCFLYISELLSPTIVFFVKPGVCCVLLFLRSQLFDIPQHYQFIQRSKNGGNKSNEIFFLCSSNIENTFDLPISLEAISVRSASKYHTFSLVFGALCKFFLWGL